MAQIESNLDPAALAEWRDFWHYRLRPTEKAAILRRMVA